MRALFGTIVEGLRGQPLALALVIINVLYLIGGAYTLREISRSIERRDAMITTLTERCIQPPT